MKKTKSAKGTVKKEKKSLSALNDKPKKVIVSRLEIKATIPTRQYENIQPLIEFKDIDLQKGTEIAMKHIIEMSAKYGEKGAFKINDEVPTPAGTTTTVKIKSFNEDVEIDFDPVNHSYSYEGKSLISATKLTSTFYKPFDAEKIAVICAKAWDVPKEEIIALWDSNGSIANELGTLIHKALEHTEIHGPNGLKISKIKKDKVNPAILKHPLLKGVIDGFNKLYKEQKIEGVVHTEVLITDVKGGYCGQADRLIAGATKCRIQDFKVNIGAEDIDKNLKPLKPFSELPATKLTKYQIQMSIYANMLEKSGSKVEALDAFVLDEKWTYYQLDILKVLN